MKKEQVKRTNTAAYKRKKKRRQKRIKRFFVLFTLLALTLGGFVASNYLFPIEKFSIGGNSIYSESEIIKASGVKKGDNLLFLPSKKIIKRISKKLPYSSKTTINKSLPNTLKITVNTAVPKYVLFNEDMYYVLDDGYKAVESVSEVPQGCIYLKTQKTEKVKLGENTVFGDDFKMIEYFLKVAEDNELNITGIDTGDSLDYKIIIDNRLLFDFGSDNDIEYKVKHMCSMLQKMESTARGYINLADWTSSKTQATFKYTQIDTKNFCELQNVE